MSNKQNYIKFILFFLILIMSCESFGNNLAGTTWETGDGKITCKFISKNIIEINYNNIQKKFLYYQEGEDIKITNTENYSQYIIKINDNKLIMDWEVVMDEKSDQFNTKIIFTNFLK